MARRAGNKLFKCDSITIPITGPASDKNYPPTKVDKGSGGVNDALCDRRRKGEPSRIGSDRIGSSRVGSGREKWNRNARGFKRELRDGRRSGEDSLKDNLVRAPVHSAKEGEKFSQFYDFDFIGRLAGRARALSLYIFRGRLSRDKGNCCILEAVPRGGEGDIVPV